MPKSYTLANWLDARATSLPEATLLGSMSWIAG